MVSFFSLSLSCLNAGARIIFPLGGHGFLPRRVHAVHAQEHDAARRARGLRSADPRRRVGLARHGTTPLTIFGDAGTLAAFGFLLAYFMITVAAPFYLRKLGELRARNIAGRGRWRSSACSCRRSAASIRRRHSRSTCSPTSSSATCCSAGRGCTACTAPQPEALPAIQRDLERALEASAHDIAMSEEEHQHQHVHAPGGRFQPEPAGAGTAAAGAGIVSASAMRQIK